MLERLSLIFFRHDRGYLLALLFFISIGVHWFILSSFTSDGSHKRAALPDRTDIYYVTGPVSSANKKEGLKEFNKRSTKTESPESSIKTARRPLPLKVAKVKKIVPHYSHAEYVDRKDAFNKKGFQTEVVKKKKTDPGAIPKAHKGVGKSEKILSALTSSSSVANHKVTQSNVTGERADNKKIFADYFKAIRDRINSSKRYPFISRRRGEEGKVTIRFSILPDGKLNSLNILKSSSYRLLDNAALEAVREASPFLSPPPSNSNEKGSLSMEICINFKLR